MADPSQSHTETGSRRSQGEELLEREGELAVIAELIATASSGAGAVAVLEGPAGIGKSTLLKSASRAALDAGFETANARASELEREFAFGLVRQLFEPLLATLTPKRRGQLFDGAAGLARPLFEAADADDLNPRVEASQAILHGLYWLTANLASRKPLALVVDDAHWADAPSLRFLAYLVNRVDGLPVLLAIGARPFEPGAEIELLDELASSPATTVIRPGPLSARAVDRLVRSSLDVDPDKTFVEACFEATKGNPLLLRDLLATLTAERIKPTAAEAHRVLEVAPRSIARSVARRLRRLAPEAGELAQALAVLGDQAELSAAAKLAGLEPDVAAVAAVALGSADILAPDGLDFVHPVVRAAVYSDLSPTQRARQHGAAAAILHESRADEDAVALHALAGQPDGEGWVIEVLRRAARRAHSRGAADVAATYLRRALAEPPPADQRTDISVELGMAALDALDWGGGLALVRDALESTDDPHARGHLALRLGRALFTLGALPQAAEVFETALADLEGGDRELERSLEAQLISVCVAVPALTLRVVDRIDRLQEESGDISDPVLLAMLGVSAVASIQPAGTGAGLAARALAGGRLSVVEEPTAVAMAGVALMNADRLDQAKKVWDEAIADARRRGSPTAVGFVLTLRALLMVRLGNLQAAEADARSALEPLGEEAQAVIPWLLPSLVDVLLERGELDAASRLVDEHGLAGELPDLLPMYYLLDSMGRLRIAQGRLDEGIVYLRECGRRLDAWTGRVLNPGVVPWRASLAPAVAAVGERDEALDLSGREVELSRAFDVPRELGMALRAAGLVHGGEEGIEMLREAVAVLEASPAELERARALTDLGAALRRKGHRSDARGPLRAGLELAHACGATALADRAHSELVATGARPRRIVLSGVDALTPSERRVSEMASEGLTNREVAQALFVTEKTVEGHLANAYRKLDISSRSELQKSLTDSREPAAR